jgi:hypothetical protein
MYTGTLDQGPSEEIPSASKISTMLFFFRKCRTVLELLGLGAESVSLSDR